MLLAACVKGAIGFGFPTVGTPLLALLVDVKTAVAVLIVPNIAMDSVQATRGGALVPTLRRFATLMIFGAIGTIAGTRLLAVLSPRIATLVLGVSVVSFVTLNATRWSPRVPARWEPWLSPPAGLIAGIIGGVTNVPGTPLVIYFYALGLTKPQFVSAVGVTFVLYKVVQLGAVAWYGLLSWNALLASLGLAVIALAGFRAGLAVQDRLDQGAFNRAVLVFLALLGAWLVYRATA